jgi:phenylpropionate dioxygenase-like ring-hydroxylating dioxygenase large terminal subunit
MTINGLIDPDFYRAPQHLSDEYGMLFSQTWSFVGLMLEHKDGSHRGVRIGTTSLIIQCDKSGKPRAFLNVCSHRHAQLCDTGLHRGPIRCPYHSWTYDCEGIPANIPQPQAFPEVVADRAAHRLKEFACEVAGQFIFVRLSEHGPGLREYLGEEYEFLLQASLGMCSVHDEFRLDVGANWKAVIENSLEGYHVPAVHNKTFMKVEGMERGHAAPVDHLEHALHSSITHPANPEWLANFEKRVEPKIGKWAWRFPYYTHHLIFPNLTITSFLGYSFHIQRFEPTAIDLTTVHSRTVGVNFENQSPVGKKMIEQIYAESKAFTDRVFSEDAVICKAVQQGLAQAERKAVIGAGIEARVSHFHHAYMQAMQAVQAV